TLGEGVAGQGVHVVVRHRVTHPVLALGGSGLTRHALLLDEVIGAQRRLLALPGLDDDLLANTKGTATPPSRVSRDTPTAASGATHYGLLCLGRNLGHIRVSPCRAPLGGRRRATRHLHST